VTNVIKDWPNDWQETSNDDRGLTSTNFPSLTLVTWNACRLLIAGKELALVNLLKATGADVATIKKCELPHTMAKFSVAGYTTFVPLAPEGGKT
jgi:hypothetical protein